MDVEQRIQNFKNMAEADPDNELGHFSLGKAYLDAARYEEAAASFRKVLDLNSGFSKAYQHLGQSLQELGRTAEAVATLKQGFEIAAQRGDVMPRDAMAHLLQELGEQPPAVQTAAPAADAPALDPGQSTVNCCRCGRTGPQLPKEPFKGTLGAQVLANVCQPCWREWLAMGTKVINELRLDLANPAAGEIYDSHMKEFLQLPS